MQAVSAFLGKKTIASLGTKVVRSVENVGSFGLFIRDVFQQMFRRPFRTKLVMQHLEFIGNQSLNVIVMAGFFTGAVFGLHIGGIFRIFKGEAIMGAATGKALARELAPIMTAFLLTARAGSAITAELATMKVNEQVDAMEAMGVDPINYLVVPRVLAAMIILPFLCGIFIFIGVLGAFVVGLLVFDVDKGMFIDKITWLVQPSDIFSGLQKAFAFSIIIVTMACRYGLKASGGAKGVGIATTTSVVVTLLTVLLFDFLITYIQIAH